jgi:hypothetical protein
LLLSQFRDLLALSRMNELKKNADAVLNAFIRCAVKQERLTIRIRRYRFD